MKRDPLASGRSRDGIYDSESEATYNSDLVLYPRTKASRAILSRETCGFLKDVVGKTSL